MNTQILKTITSTTKGRFFTVESKRKDGSTIRVNGKVVPNARHTKGKYITILKARKDSQGKNQYCVIDCNKFNQINFDNNTLYINQ